MSLTDIFKNIIKFFTGTREIANPQTIIPRDSISLNETKLILDIAKLTIPFKQTPYIINPIIADTNSMDGLFDANNTVLILKPRNSEDHQLLCDRLKVGDIAGYETNFNLVIHRIIKIEQYQGKRRFIFKGDNNAGADSAVVTDGNIQFLCFGIIF